MGDAMFPDRRPTEPPAMTTPLSLIAKKIIELAGKVTPGPYSVRLDITSGAEIIAPDDAVVWTCPNPYGPLTRDHIVKASAVHAEFKTRAISNAKYFAACDPTTVTRLAKAADAGEELAKALDACRVICPADGSPPYFQDKDIDEALAKYRTAIKE